MKIVIAIVKMINNVNEKIARYVSYLTFLLILTLAYEVLVRYGFDSPTQWSYDLTYFLCSMAMILGMAYTWQTGGHVAVDLISSKLPRRLVAALNVFFMLAMFFFCWIGILWAMTWDVLNAWKILERSTTGFMPPVYPYKTWIYVGVAMLVLQGIVVFTKELYMMIKGEELS